MKTFVDSHDRRWELSLTLGSAKRIRDRLGLDLLRPEGKPDGADVPTLTRLGVDELLLGEVLAILLEPQFESHQITPDQIWDTFDGATVLRAAEAFWSELADFFRQRGQEHRLRMIEKQRAAIQAGMDRATEVIEAVDVEAELDAAFGRTSTPSPGPSGSSPTD